MLDGHGNQNKGEIMSVKEKGILIGLILTHLKFHVLEHNKGLSKHHQHKVKSFDYGDTFFSLCFKTDKELNHIARLAGV